MGSEFRCLGQHNEAKEYHEKALIIYKKIFGEEHPNVASCYNDLGNDYQRLGQYNEAKEYHEKALVVKKKIFGEEHANVASCYNNLGNDYQHLGQYSEAKQNYEKALIIKQCSEGDECEKNARDICKLYNQTRKTDSTSLTSSKLPCLENC